MTKGVKQPRWTPEEDAILYAHYQPPSQLSSKVISSKYLPHRTACAVDERAYNLGMHKQTRGVVCTMPWLVWSALQQGPGMPQEIIARTGMKDASGIYKLLRMFHKKAGVTYIIRWVNRGRWVPIYAIGSDEMDAPKPKRSGRAREHYGKRHVTLKGNPFAGLIIEAEREHTQPQEDVCP